MKRPFVVFHEDSDCLFLTNDAQSRLRTHPKSILWVRQGQYGMIPSAVIQNELRVRADRKRLWDAEHGHSKRKDYWDIPLGFRWAETEDVPNGSKLIDLFEKHGDDCSTSDADKSHHQGPNVL